MAAKHEYIEPQPTSEHGFRVEAHCRPDVKRGHNIRDPQYVATRKNIDLDLPHQTLVDLGTIPEAFDKLFGPAIEEYNSEQRRKDRRKTAEGYAAEFLQSREQTEDKQKATGRDRGKDFTQACYEFQYQIGNRDNFPDREKASEILTKFVTEEFPKRWPLVRTAGAYLHNDEFSIDSKTGKRIRSPSMIHHDIIFTAERLTKEELADFKKFKASEKERLKKEAAEKGEKFNEEKWQKMNWQKVCYERYGKVLTTSLPLQCSMSACLAQMGYFTEKGKGTAQQQWEEDVRHSLQDFAESYGLKIDRTSGPKHKHMTCDEWQLHKENEKKSKELDVTIDAINSEIADMNKSAEQLNNRWSVVYSADEKVRKAKQLEKDANEKLEEATRKEQNANSKELRNELAKTANDNKKEELKKKETELSEKEASLKRREEVYFEKFDNLKEIEYNQKIEREIEEADREYLESIKYDYSRLKNVTSMKDVEIARLNGELKVTKEYVEELKIMEGAWIKTRDGILVQAGSFEYYQEMEELKRCHGSYAKNPTPQNVENMVDAFFSGLKNLFNNLENWFMNMTPGYLRKLANALESRGCRNYSEYRRGIVRSGIER